MKTRSGVFAVAITVLLLMALTMNSVSAESKAKVKLGPTDADKMKLNHTDAAKGNLNHTNVARGELNHSDAAREKPNHTDVAKGKLNHSDAAKENSNHTDVAKVALNPSESMPFQTERAVNELIYDDGTAEDAYAWSSAGNGFAVRFTPLSYPVDILTARICFWPDGPDSDHEEFAVYVYDDDGPGGKPSTCLGDPIYHTATAWGWCDVDISGLGITIENGDFYILYKQLTDDPDCEGLCRDLSLPQYGRSWDYYYDGSWDFWNENYMIRCVVDDDTTDCGNMGVNPTSWSPTLNCGESDDEIVTVSATGGTVKGVTVSKVSGPTWLSVSQTDLGDIASGSSKTFTMTASSPSETSGDFGYTVRVSNTCGSPSSIDVSGTIHVDCPESSWTFMIYLDGDNNLEGAAIDDFMEMSSVGSTPAVNIVVQFDRIPGYDTSYDDWTDCKRFLVTSGMTPMPVNAISDLGECNMGDPNTLDAFVTWAMTEFPADNYALVLWNHGDGWKSINNWVPWADDIKDAKDAGLSRGICVDNTNNDYLSLQETEVALTGKSVQLLGYDACLMHMVEVVYQVMANAGVSVGSEEVEPWDGWPYDTILTDLTGMPTMNEDALGTVIVDRYMDSYGYTGSQTQSAVDNLELPNLVTAVDNLAQALINEINGSHWTQVQEARNAAEEIYYNYYIDLYHFAEMVDTHVPSATAQAQAVMYEVSKMYEAHGTSVPNDHGLSIYFPQVEGEYLLSYDNTAFASDTQWNEFLKRYYEGPVLVCDGTDTSCGSYPNCENCNVYDGCYPYGDGCEERDYYCVSNEVGCGYTYSNRHTDYYDDFVNYCKGDEVWKHRQFHDFYCDAGSCTDHTSLVDDQLVENCNDHDGWVDTGNKKWVDENECQEKEQKEQQYRDYYCSGGACTYSVTSTQWVDTENTRNKTDGTICGCTASNTLKRCYGGVCTDTGICNSTTCGADAACDGKRPGDSCGGGTCDSNCKCGGQAVGEDYGVFRDGLWILPPNYRFNFGMSTDIPITGDWNGNGVDTIGVRRGRQWILSNSNAAPSVAYRVNYGSSTDRPVVGDWNGDGVDTIGVHRGRQWILSNSNTAPSVAYRVNYGMSTDRPVVGDWNGDGVDTIGVRRGSQWILSNSNTAPSVAYRFNYGMSSDEPVTGDWI